MYDACMRLVLDRLQQRVKIKLPFHTYFFFHAGIMLFDCVCNLGQSQFSEAANIEGGRQFSHSFRALKVKQLKVRKACSVLLEEQAFLSLSLFSEAEGEK